jgi:hypothetical protein
MRTSIRPAKAPTISVDHLAAQVDPDYRHTMRERLATAVDAAMAAHEPGMLPVIEPKHVVGAECCLREVWVVTLARLTGALQSASPRHR